MNRLTAHSGAPVRKEKCIFINSCDAFANVEILIDRLSAGIININNSLFASFAEHSYMIFAYVRKVQSDYFGYSQATI